MQWIIQDFENNANLVEALERVGIDYSVHKLIPFAGEFTPEPIIKDKNKVILYGGYSLWRYAERNNLNPGVFKIPSFADEEVWKEYSLNSNDYVRIRVEDIPSTYSKSETPIFVRPVDDSKSIAGTIMSMDELVSLCERILKIDIDDIPKGSLRHDEEIMLCKPVRIYKEWRTWVVNNRIVTYSLYKEGNRVVYRREIDDDALSFARKMVEVNPFYSDAYVLDICRTEDGLKLLETNCINAAGFYAADVSNLVVELDNVKNKDNN